MEMCIYIGIRKGIRLKGRKMEVMDMERRGAE